MQKIPEPTKVVQLSSVKLDQFLKLLADLGRDEYHPHLASKVYDDYRANIAANERAKQSLRDQRAG